MTDLPSFNADDVRGKCPRCGRPVISELVYVDGRGYLVIWSCVAASGASPACDYRRVL